MNIHIPDSIKRGMWDLIRPYKDNRYYLRDVIPGLPGLLKPLLRESVGLGGLLTKTIGPDYKV